MTMLVCDPVGDAQTQFPAPSAADHFRSVAGCPQVHRICEKHIELGRHLQPDGFIKLNWPQGDRPVGLDLRGRLMKVGLGSDRAGCEIIAGSLCVHKFHLL
jgi:hypothetical protein